MRSIRVWILSLVAVLVAGAAFAASAAAAGGIVPTGADGTAGIANQDGPRYVVLSGVLAKLEDQRITRVQQLPPNMGIPAVASGGEPGGLSTDGGTIVLADTMNAFQGHSVFLLIETERLRTTERISLDGSYSFDAISPDGSLIYLVHTFDPRDPIDYEVRIYDVGAGRLVKDPVVDPSAPGEQMGGYPYARAYSPDGRWAYTLYDGGEEPFVHALDTVGRTAVCVDLDEDLPIGNGSTLEASSDGATLLLGRRGEQLASIDTAGWEVTAPPAVAAGSAAAEGGTDPWKVVAAAGALALLAAALMVRSLRARRRAAQAGAMP